MGTEQRVKLMKKSRPLASKFSIVYSITKVSIIFEIVEQVMILPVVVCGLDVIDCMSKVIE